MDPIEAKHEFATLETTVRKHLGDALTLAHGNQREAALLLGVSRWTLARMVRRFGLQGLVSAMKRERDDVRRTAVEQGSPDTATTRHDAGS